MGGVAIPDYHYMHFMGKHQIWKPDYVIHIYLTSSAENIYVQSHIWKKLRDILQVTQAYHHQFQLQLELQWQQRRRLLTYGRPLKL